MLKFDLFRQFRRLSTLRDRCDLTRNIPSFIVTTDRVLFPIQSDKYRFASVSISMCNLKRVDGDTVYPEETWKNINFDTENKNIEALQNIKKMLTKKFCTIKELSMKKFHSNCGRNLFRQSDASNHLTFSSNPEMFHKASKH